MKQTLNKTMCISPFLLAQIISSAAKRSHHEFKLLQIIHYLLSLSLFFFHFFLSLLSSLISSLHSSSENNNPINPTIVVRKQNEILHQGDSGISRALSQILSLMNEIPVTSRKYETVRLLAEKIMDENLEERCEALREVNRTVLVNAYGKTIEQLEVAMLEKEKERVEEISGSGLLDCKLGWWIWNAVRVLRDGAGSRVNSRRVGWSAEKFAAEVYWLAQKLVACGNGEVAVSVWGSASNLGTLALSAEPRVQGSLVKVSAFLFKQAKEINENDGQGQKMMLMSWLPLLCCASGIDSPILSSSEGMELEQVLADIIGQLTQKDEEKVLALWLHHFTSCSSSDWPNLQTCYSRWCLASRKELSAQ